MPGKAMPGKATRLASDPDTESSAIYKFLFNKY